MSYKFDLDHTLAIADIHDMITIDIKPETWCSVREGDIEIQGYLSFRGSYLTPDFGEAPFEGSLPLDITLPYLGGSPNVQPEVVAFDYRVENEESLTLHLEVALSGYAIEEPQERGTMNPWLDSSVSDHHEEAPYEHVETNDRTHPDEVHNHDENSREEAMNPWHQPVVNDSVYEEAVIEPFDFATTASTEVKAASEQDFQPRIEEVVVEEEEVYEEIAVAVEEEIFEEVEVAVSEEVREVVVEVEEEISDEEAVVEVEEIYEEETVVVEEELREEVAVVEEEVVVEAEEELREEVAVVEEEIPYSPLIETHDHSAFAMENPLEDQMVEVESHVMEDVIPRLEEVSERITPKVTASAAALMDELFALKREKAFVIEEEVPSAVVVEEECEREVETSAIEELEDEVEEVLEHEDEESEVDEAEVFVSSIARQFADGETTIKMVYVGHETQTLGGVLERHEATLDDVWNLSELANGVEVGDCVMLRYEKSI